MSFGIKEVIAEYLRRASNPYIPSTLSPQQQSLYTQYTNFYYLPSFFEPQKISTSIGILSILEQLKARPLHYYTHVPYKEIGYYATGWPLELLGIKEKDLERVVDALNELNPPFYVLAAMAPAEKGKVRPIGILVQIRMDKILGL